MFHLFYAIGFLIAKFFRTIYNGIFVASKQNKVLRIVYVILGAIAVIVYFVTGTLYIMVLLIGFIALVSGMIINAQEYVEKEKSDFYDDMFREIGLKTSDDTVIKFMYEEAEEYAKVYAFYTVVPISSWLSKKDKLGMCLNTPILDIVQDRKNNRIVYVVTKVKELPTQIAWNDSYLENADMFALGIGYYGKVAISLAVYPHWFIAGETGSGKSNLLKCLIYQAIQKRYEVVLIDFKRGVSFSSFSKTVKMYYEYDETMILLQEMVAETKHRLDFYRESGVDSLKEYNQKNKNTPMQRKIIFIDELAELLKVRDKEISNTLYDALETLTRISRSAGIHLIMGVQRADSSVINGQIKSNVPLRICGHFADREPSRIMLSNDSASFLPDIKGRFIVKGSTQQEIQTFYYNNMPISSSKKEYEKPKVTEPVTQQEKKTPEKKVFDFDFTDINK